MPTTFLILPGYGNSNENHWQSYFEKQLPNCHRVAQKSWDNPRCDDWVQAINEAINACAANSVVLVSHSMGGIAIAHWASRFSTKIKGAFIVAPPDLENPCMDLPIEGFTPIPLVKFSFPSVVVASTNDTWSTVERAQTFADSWGSKLIVIGEAGHINATSGHGAWNQGLELLKLLDTEQ